MPIKSLQESALVLGGARAAELHRVGWEGGGVGVALHEVDALLQVALHLHKLRVGAVRRSADLRAYILQLLLIPVKASHAQRGLKALQVGCKWRTFAAAAAAVPAMHPPAIQLQT